MTLKNKRKTAALPGKSGRESPACVKRRWQRRYPIECPRCGHVLHQGHAEIYGECVLCGSHVRESKP
jgi:hypothetical protein